MSDKDKKRYYWIKLKTDFFSREDIDFLLSQKNGAEYVVLYQMLCLNTANNDGKLESQIGEMIVRFDAEKVVRDCKYFDIDTVNVAMSLYKQMGLIYEQEDGTLRISDFDNLVGSESKWAKYKQKQKKLENFQSNSNLLPNNFQQENRDKSIENRDKNIENSSSNIIEFSKRELKIIKQLEKWFDEELLKDGFTTTTTFNNNTLNEIKKLFEKGYKQKDLGYVLGYLHYYWVEHPEFHKTDMSANYIPEKIFNVDKFSDRLLQAQIYFSKESD